MLIDAGASSPPVLSALARGFAASGRWGADGDAGGALAAREGAACAEAGLAAALDLFGQAGVLIDGAGRVLHINAAASAFVGDGVLLSQMRLRAGAREFDARLQAMVAQALTSTCHASHESIAAVALPRREGRPLVGRAAPLPHDSFREARALVTLTLLEACAAPAASLLAQAYGLTQAESRLAWQMAGCSGLIAAAAALRVSVSTARTHLKAIFAKTDTRSQAQLATLLASAGLGLGGGSRA